MSKTHSLSVAFVVLSTAVVSGCAGRQAPFDSLDQSTVTILKLQQNAPQTALPAPTGGVPLIPGIPPELQTAAQQVVNQLQAQGLIPPGLIPGVGGPTAPPTQPAMTPYPNDPQWAIADTRPVVDQKLKDDLLDLFGKSENFTDEPRQCWFPGMAVSFQSPNFPQPVDVVVSVSCRQAVGYGFQWPHTGASGQPSQGLAPRAQGTLTGIYQSLFGPLPAQGG